jgi:hypothetical protein
MPAAMVDMAMTRSQCIQPMAVFRERRFPSPYRLRLAFGPPTTEAMALPLWPILGAGQYKRLLEDLSLVAPALALHRGALAALPGSLRS